MKKILTLLALVAIISSCSTGTGYKINGTVDTPELEGTYAYIQVREGRNLNTVDSALITDGKFELVGDAQNTVVRYISFDPQVVGRVSAQIVIEPGNIIVDGISDGIKIKGTKLNEALAAHEAFVLEKQTAMREISQNFQQASQEGTVNEEMESEFRGQFEAIGDELTAKTVAFIKSNIGNELGQFLFLTNASGFEHDVQDEILALSDDAFKSKEEVKSIIENLEKAKRVAIGQKFVDFSMNNVEGTTVSLSDYAGKGNVVLIDFWAAWCGPCRQEMPNVVNAYKEFKDKGFEVVGVSLDRNQEEWEKGISDLEMTWPQMSDLSYWDSPVISLYAFRGIPHTVLIDGEGTIIAKNLRGQELHDKLAEVLSK